jgi:type II secretory pathway predicted ATPase ExeA
MSTALKSALRSQRLTYKDLSAAMRMNGGAISRLLNQGELPARREPESFKAELTGFLVNSGVAAVVAQGAVSGLKEKAAIEVEASTAAVTPEQTAHLTQGIIDMLLRKQSLSAEARKAFSLFNSPFDGEVTSSAEMFLSTDIRYCREASWNAAKHGRFIAIVGESGAGKTTILGDLEDRIAQDKSEIVVIKPSVLGMEDNDIRGKTLKMGGILDSIVYTLDPTSTPRRTMEAKTRQVRQLLTESIKAGNTHLLVIEESHSLPVSTLRQLKRLHEERMGRKPLLGILLLGQPELGMKLDEKRHDLREVVQRCEVATLEPLDTELEKYVAHRLAREGRKVDELFEKDAFEAMRARFIIRKKDGSRERTLSLLYPLAVNNFLTAALNLAAEIGAPKVSGDVVGEV